MKIRQLYTLNPVTGQMVFETFNEIIRKSDDKIILVELNEDYELKLNGQHEIYQLDDKYEINKHLLLRSGFIQVHKNYMVNSHCITRLFTDESKIELQHSLCIPFTAEYESNIKYFLSKINL